MDGPDSGDQCGYAVCGAGDVDADGTDDFLVGLPYADPGGRTDAGSMFVIGGADGRLIWRIQGDESGQRLGAALAAGADANGDGYGDFLIGAPYASPGGILHAGSAFLVSGRDGTTLVRVDGAWGEGLLGQDLAFTGDLSGDGLPDFVVGVPQADPNGALDAGEILIVDSVTGQVIRDLQGVDAGGNLGWSVADAGDVDGDGLSEVVAGAYLNSANGLQSSGSVIVFRGSDGTVLHHWMGGASWDRLGWNVAGVGDADGDLVPDILASAPFSDVLGFTDAGEALLFSGRTGDLIMAWAGSANDDRLGYGLAGAGDVDADGTEDLLVGIYWGDPNGVPNAGEVRTLSLDAWLRADADEVSSSLGGTIQFLLDFPDTEAGKLYALLASPNGTGPTFVKDVEVPLTRDPLFEAMLDGYRPPPLEDITGTLDAQGQAVASLVNPPGGMDKYIGWNLYAAALSGDGPGAPRLSSAAVAVRVVP